jgi:deoxyribodipyrimidine photo-lyase
MIQDERIHQLNGAAPRAGSWVLCWMQASQRASCNHALEVAIRAANERRLPVVVGFGLADRYPGANLRHYRFMLEGLAETQRELASRGIAMVVRRGEPDGVAATLARRAALCVVDAGYTRIQRRWRRRAARAMACPLLEVESDVVVPVREASAKEEYAAATFRPKVLRALPRYLVPLREQHPKARSLSLNLPSLALGDIESLLAALPLDRRVAAAPGVRGGTAEARRRLAAFIEDRLDRFAAERNDPSRDACSHLSPYLHFGQIAPLEVALAVRGAASPSSEAFLEELVVRRELAINFVAFNPRYDRVESLPSWALATLAKHARDRREATYGRRELEAARTHDAIWNAAQREMVLTGKMHGYLRMYWGKKILEWSATPAAAYRTALALNDRYELDGRDPNGFAGVAWCFGKHDRPWGERRVYGIVRSMTEAGLRRKFDVDRYVARIDALARELR